MATKKQADDMAKSSSNVILYVVAMVVVAALTMMAVLAILFLRPTATDNTLYITAVIGVITPIIGILIVLLQRENHLTMNSRLDQLLQVSKATSRAEGVIEGQIERRASEDKPAVKKAP